jgi:beta-lactamase superfamily II metal-dependent hydrolase
MRVINFDVEHGSSHIIRTPNDQIVIIDAGSTESFSPAIYLKDTWGITNIRWFTLTHHDADHLTDINNIAEYLHVQTLHSPEIEIDELNHLYDEFSTPLEVFLEYKKNFTTPAPPMSDPSYSWGGVQFATFGNKLVDFENPNINDLSVVTFASYMGWNFIFPGDLETPGWMKLLEIEEFRNRLSGIDIFIASHHGRESGYCEDVFSYCTPKIVILSDKSNSETSCADSYRNFAQGLPVTNGAGVSNRRYVLTTRTDGAISLYIDPQGRCLINTSQ